MKRLNEATAAAARCIEPGRQLDIYDPGLRGFMLRVSPSTKVWSLLYKVRGSDGGRRRLNLGPWPVYSYSQARDKAIKALFEAGEGRDPSRLPEFANLRPPRANPRKAKPYQPPRSWAGADVLTVADLVREFLALNSHKRTAAEDQRIYNRELLGLDMNGEPRPGVKPADTWAGWRLDDKSINWHRALVQLMRRKQAEGSPYAARQLFATVRHLIKWGLGEGLDFAGKVAFEVNDLPKTEGRERPLTDAEIPHVLAALDASDMEANLKRIIRFLLLTGQRSGEVRMMHVRELDRAAGLWKLPPERTKNGLKHHLPLTPAMLAIIDEGTPVNGWVFPSKRTGDCYRMHTVSLAVQRMCKAHLPDMPAFRPHDLRHTTNTGMRELQIEKATRKAVHNHADGDVSDGYNHAQVIEEKRAALLRWQDHVAALITPPDGDKVVRLHR